MPTGIYKRTEKNKGKNNGNWKGGKIKRYCLLCNKELEKFPSRIKEGKGKFCSHKCKDIWQSQNIIGKNSYNWKGGKIKRTCKTCNKEFLAFPRDIKNGFGIYCSHRCRSINTIKHMKTKDTSIELIIEQELIKNKIPYMKQVPIEGIALVDFLLPNKIIIQCDGDWWHRKEYNKGKDISQDTVLTFKGYKVFRFWEKDINKSSEKCIEKVLKYMEVPENYGK